MAKANCYKRKHLVGALNVALVELCTSIHRGVCVQRQSRNRQKSMVLAWAFETSKLHLVLGKQYTGTKHASI